MNTRIEWVLQDFSVEPPASRYEGHWHATDADVGEEGHWDSLTAALAWGRARAPVVVLHIWVGSPRRSVTYSAGTSRWQRFLEWHEPSDPDAVRVEHHSGSAVITESPYDWVPRETFSLMTEVRTNGEVETTAGESGLPVLDALELARSRSAFVLVGIVQLPDATPTSTLARDRLQQRPTRPTPVSRIAVGWASVLSPEGCRRGA